MELPINQIICGDCSKIISQFPLCSIDLVFTDPPYLKEYLYTYKYLADLCPKIMHQGASLVTIVGHYAVPQVLDIFAGKLKYRWLLCMNQFEGNHPRMMMGIEVMWKPMLWFVKGSYPQGRGYLRDGIEIDFQKKKYHKWEQDISWCKYYIEKLTKEGDTVLDPFCGSGTVCVATKQLGRNYIGIDISEEYCKIARERIKQ